MLSKFLPWYWLEGYYNQAKNAGKHELFQMSDKEFMKKLFLRVIEKQIKTVSPKRGSLTMRPLQYGFSRALVLGAHQHNHNPRHDITKPTRI